MNPLHFFIVFVAALALDIAWGKYTLRVSKHQIRGAVIWACCISLLAGVNIDAIARNIWYVIPSVLGAAAGTWLVLKHEQKNQS